MTYSQPRNSTQKIDKVKAIIQKLNLSWSNLDIIATEIVNELTVSTTISELKWEGDDTFLYNDEGYLIRQTIDGKYQVYRKSVKQHDFLGLFDDIILAKLQCNIEHSYKIHSYINAV